LEFLVEIEAAASPDVDANSLANLVRREHNPRDHNLAPTEPSTMSLVGVPAAVQRAAVAWRAASGATDASSIASRGQGWVAREFHTAVTTVERDAAGLA
jgi:hypothetical protein